MAVPADIEAIRGQNAMRVGTRTLLPNSRATTDDDDRFASVLATSAFRPEGCEPRTTKLWRGRPVKPKDPGCYSYGERGGFIKRQVFRNLLYPAQSVSVYTELQRQMFVRTLAATSAEVMENCWNAPPRVSNVPSKNLARDVSQMFAFIGRVHVPPLTLCRLPRSRRRPHRPPRPCPLRRTQEQQDIWR